MIGAQAYYRNCGFVHFTEEEEKMIHYIVFGTAGFLLVLAVVVWLLGTSLMLLQASI